jgi:imidazole glycerol-phosphate synthase subunit HisH
MTVVIVDYGMGNLASARRAFEECGGSVEVSADARSLQRASHIVIPGVGSFTQAMQRLKVGGWIDAIKQAALKDQIPLLGICLGMHLLADVGEEGGGADGLGLIGGSVLRIKPNEHERVPHVGWNEVMPSPGSKLFAKIPDSSDFYFVHSYHFVPTQSQAIAATTAFSGGLVSGVSAGHIHGVQFHPEKSSRVGFQLIRNFLAQPC